MQIRTAALWLAAAGIAWGSVGAQAQCYDPLDILGKTWTIEEIHSTDFGPHCDPSPPNDNDDVVVIVVKAPRLFDNSYLARRSAASNLTSSERGTIGSVTPKELAEIASEALDEEVTEEEAEETQHDVEVVEDYFQDWLDALNTIAENAYEYCPDIFSVLGAAAITYEVSYGTIDVLKATVKGTFARVAAPAAVLGLLFCRLWDRVREDSALLAPPGSSGYVENLAAMPLEARRREQDVPA